MILLRWKAMITITLTHDITASGLPEPVRQEIRQKLTFVNPDYLNKIRYRKREATPLPEKHLTLFQDQGDMMSMPRGFGRELILILGRHRITQYQIQERLPDFDVVPLVFKGNFMDFQYPVFHKLIKMRNASLVGPHQCGKKAIACGLIAERRLPTLIVVKQIDQAAIWEQTIKRFLNHEPGMIGAGRQEIDNDILIGIDRSVYKIMDTLKHRIGFVVVPYDANRKIFYRIANELSPKFTLAVGVNRFDKLHGFVQACCGPLVQIDSEYAGRGNPYGTPYLVSNKTRFVFDYKDDFHSLIDALTENKDRNLLIATDIRQRRAEGLRVLVLSERLRHLSSLDEIVQQSGVFSGEIVSGSLTQKARDDSRVKFNRGEIILYASYQGLSLLGKIRPDVVVFASPCAGPTIVAESVRLCAGHDSKGRKYIYDYWDRVPVLENAMKSRVKVYQSCGIKW